MKKRIIIITTIFISALLLVGGVIFLLLNSKTEEKRAFGVWWWNDQLDQNVYLDFVEKQGVNEIYYCSSKFNADTENFIKNANEKDIKVYFLAGEYQWIYNYDSLKSKLNSYISYQQNYRYNFEGVHLDIEPHQHPEFDNKRNEIITKFAELCYRVKQEFPNLYVEYDLPFWLDDEISLNGQKKSAYKFVIDYSSRVTVMSYRDTSEQIYGVAKEEIEYANSLGKKINLGVETKSGEGDKVSFMEEGKRYMMQELNSLRKTTNSSVGIVIHHVYTWYNLQD